MLRFVARTVALTLVIAAMSAAHAQTFPSRPLRLIVPFPAGGSTDLLGRAVAQRLSTALGQPVVVENRPGANTIVAYEATRNSPADGYTMLFEAFNGLVLNPNLYKKLPYDAERDFTSIAQVATSSFILIVNPAVPAKSLAEFVSYIRDKQGKVDFASCGIGCSLHVAYESFMSVANIKMNHIPYKGSADALPAIVNGTVPTMMDTPITSLPFIRAGKVRALAATGATRLSALPDLPTIAELGYPGFSGGTYYSVVARSGTPQAAIDRLSTEIQRVAAMSELRDLFGPQGIDMAPGSAESLTALLRADRAKYATVIRNAGITLEQ